MFPTLSEETTDDNKSNPAQLRLGVDPLLDALWRKSFSKEGHDDGWRHYAVCFDKQKSGIVIMTNSRNGEGIFKDVLETVLKNTFTPIAWERYTPYDKLPPRPPLKQHKKVAVDGKVLDRYVGRYATPAGHHSDGASRRRSPFGARE